MGACQSELVGQEQSLDREEDNVAGSHLKADVELAVTASTGRTSNVAIRMNHERSIQIRVDGGAGRHGLVLGNKG